MTAQTVGKEKKKMRYSDTELGLIKTTFADNEDMIKALRKVFMQVPLDLIDKSIVEQIKGNRDLLEVIKKTFLPQIDINAPLHQMVDLWMTIDLKDKNLEQAGINIASRELLIEYLGEQIRFIEKGTKPKISFSSFIPKDFVLARATEAVINLNVRNTVISHVEQMLLQLNVLAGRKEETVEQTRERLQKDSTR